MRIRDSTPRGGRRALRHSPVAWLLRAAGLAGGHRRRRARTTGADPTRAPAPHLVARAFTVPAPERRWSGDSTDVATWEGRRYLAVLLDAHARRVVGWALADRLRAALARDALAPALAVRHPAPGLIHHTDRGCQYPACGHRATLADGYDKAMAERCFATVKAALGATRPRPARRAARHAIGAWVAVRYHRRRSHAALGYRNPAACARALDAAVRAA